MEYLLALLLIVFGIMRYDFTPHNPNENKYLAVVFLFLAFLSAFQYMVGSDIINYIKEFEYGYNLSSSDSITGNSFRQPGWVLLVAFCKSVSSDFLLLKLIQAFFVNFAIYRFVLSRESAKFTTVLFYFVFLYLNLNFNILRESFAIAFFLLSYPYLEQHKWGKYYILCFLALMFHLSAIVLFLLPLVMLFPINYKTIIFSLFAVAIMIGVSIRIGLSEIMLRMTLLMDPESAIYENSMRYLDNDKYSDSFSPIILLFVIVNLLPLLYYTNKRRQIKDNKYFVLMIQISLLYFTLDTLNRIVPIFYRFNQYFMIIYFALLSMFIFDYSKRFKKESIRWLYVVILFIYLFPAKSYFVVNKQYGYPEIVQYYPYHSVFSKEVDPVRKKLFY